MALVSQKYLPLPLREGVGGRGKPPATSATNQPPSSNYPFTPNPRMN